MNGCITSGAKCGITFYHGLGTTKKDNFSWHRHCERGDRSEKDKSLIKGYLYFANGTLSSQQFLSWPIYIWAPYSII